MAGRGDSPLAVCAYKDGRGHLLAFTRSTLADLATLHGDKAVWQRVDRYGAAVMEVSIDGPIPLDVDTSADYEALAGSAGL